MGAKLTLEQEGFLQSYRDTMLQLFDVAMSNTTVESTHESFERVRLAREQLEALNNGLLVLFAKAWLKGCLVMHDIDKTVINEATIDQFVQKLLLAQVKLPNSGNAKDIYHVVAPLSYADKHKIVVLFYASIDLLCKIDIPELKI
jgi:hypothetical protein